VEALNGGHISTMHLGSQQLAGIHDPAVQNHRTRATLPDLTTWFRTRQAKVFPEQVQERDTGWSLQFDRLSV
jgi:hypothetical protein